MIEISRHKIPSRTNRVLALFIHYALKIFFAVLSLLSLQRRSKKETIPVISVKKILIIRMDGIGDIAKSTSAFKALKYIFPHAYISLLAASGSRQLVEVMPIFNEVIYFDSYLKTIQELKKRKFDFAIDLRGDFRNNILMYICGIPYRMGYNVTGCGFLLTHVIEDTSGDFFKTMHISNLIRMFELKSIDTTPELWIKPEDERFAEENLDTQIFKIALHPVSARWPLKNWSLEGFSMISNRLLSRYNAELVFLGDKDDAEGIKKIVELIDNKNIKNFSGKTTLRQTIAILKKCSFFIGLDSGLMHIADMLGIPIVALFGPGNDALFSPSNSESIVIKKNIACRPCAMRRCIRGDNICMKSITPDEVWQAIENQMGRILRQKDENLAYRPAV
jgi:heptosyltransferase-2